MRRPVVGVFASLALSLPVSAREPRAERLAFERTPILDVLKAMSVFTGRSFILPPGTDGLELTLVSEVEVAPEEAFAGLEAALNACGLALFPDHSRGGPALRLDWKRTYCWSAHPPPCWAAGNP